jgi:HAE1 family hydrophobic/amphiphilic exporter-1
MNIAELSIRRPIFMTCLILLSVTVGLFAMRKLPVDLFPDVTFPIVFIQTVYPGAGPAEVESLVSKPIEDEISTLAGIKRISSTNQESVSVVVAEFTLETDVKYAEQQIRDRVGAVKRRLPDDIQEPTIKRLDPSEQPVVTLSLRGELPAAELFDLASETIKPQLEQVSQVGQVVIYGGRKREVQVQLDRQKLKSRELSAGLVANRLGGAGENIPAGKKASGDQETIFRTVGEFTSIEDIRRLVVTFFGNDVATRISDLGVVVDTLKDETSRVLVNGEPALQLAVFKQSRANTVAVVDGVKLKLDKINRDLAKRAGAPQLGLIRDGAKFIRANIADVYESILIGIVLAVVVVFLFLGSARSTVITGLALPNSLIGAFILMWYFGYSINIMTLLALSLSVGLLIDDAIVVRENIFRHLEMGKSPFQAAVEGTGEVRLAVIATTLTVIAVFGPLGFLGGVVGQFFKQFGLTVCFALLISLFDALTVAPMLSAYFAGRGGHSGSGNSKKSSYQLAKQAVLAPFERGQVALEQGYTRLLRLVLTHPIKSLGVSLVIFVVSVSFVRWIPKTFLPTQDSGEFTVAIDLPPGTSLQRMAAMTSEIDKVIRANPEVELVAATIGSRDGDPNFADLYVKLVEAKSRPGVSTSDLKAKLRKQLIPFAQANPKVKDFDAVGGGQRPFTMNITGFDREVLEREGLKVLERLKSIPGLLDVDINFRPGKPEFQVRPDLAKAEMLGVSTASIGRELRAQVEGIEAARFRERGIEYDVRVRVIDAQRDLKQAFPTLYVPNLNNNLIRLADVAQPVSATGPSKISRIDRNRYVQIGADIAPGAGLGDVMNQISAIMDSELKLPEGYQYAFVGQAENFKELGDSMLIAVFAGVLFIFMVLASLYESFITPLTIMLALPLAVCGAFVALFIGRETLNIFSMISLIMLIGVATKNGILLVDYANHLRLQGVDRAQAILEAGRTRLRPILMTSMALIAGFIPIAIGLNEASKQRTAMGVALIGGLISSTLLTLVVVPAAYLYIDRFRSWAEGGFARLFVSGGKDEN